MTESRKVFIRDATGLVRNMGVGAGFAYNLITVGVLLPFTYLLAVYAFPNGDMAIGFLIATFFSFFYSVTYALLSSSLPRSGGEYMFQSRILSGAVAFPIVLNGFVIWQIYIQCTLVWTAANTAIQPLLAFLSVYLNNPGLNDAGNFIITPNGEMILSVIMLGFVFLMLMKGLRYFVKLMWLFWAGVMISLALIIFLLASNTTSSFISSFNSWSAIFNPSTPDFYHYVMNNVTQSGISLSYNFNWFDTFGMGVYAAIVSLFWAMVTCGNLGEIKNATVVKNQVIMVTGGTVVAGVLMVFIGGLLQHVTGFEFVKAFSYAYTVGSISFPIAPFPASFASVLTHNPIIVTLIMIGVFFTALNILFEITVYGTRVAVSMAFDRVLPKALADVSPKWNAPLKAQLLFFIGGLIGCAIYFYVPNSFYYTLSIYVPTMFSLGITQLSGAIFPFVRKETYNASPIARYKVGNVPLITVTGLISFAYLVIAICYMFAVPALGIVYLWPLVAIGVTMLLAVLWYFGWKAHQKKKGIDITLAFKEVPPE